MNGKTYLLIALFTSTTLSAFSQDEATPASSANDIKEKYEWRIQQTKLAGQYIPKDIFDAFKELEKLTDSTARNKFRDATEYDAEHKLYFSLGRWICSNWGLYEGSRLGQYFREAGLSFPEDQAVAVLVGWHRKLNGKDIGFKEIRERFAAKHQKEREERMTKSEIGKEKIVKPASKN